MNNNNRINNLFKKKLLEYKNKQEEDVLEEITFKFDISKNNLYEKYNYLVQGLQIGGKTMNG